MKADATATELRKTGISVVGDVPWGTHFCYFYQTQQDLLDTLVPYFKAGLENKEFCLWIISMSELLTVDEATAALRKALPNLGSYVDDGSIEIVPHDQWFLNGGVFDYHRVAREFKVKLDEVLAKGFAGMRVNGSPAWMQTKHAEELREFEAEVAQLFPNERIIASCTYPLAPMSGNQIFDIVHLHQFAIARRQGEWEVIETPELKEAKAEIKRLNDELEKKVEQRTRALKAEIAERKLAEEAVKRAENRIRLVIDTTPALIHTGRPDGYLDYFNQRWLKYVGLSLEEIKGWAWTNVIHPEDVEGMVNEWRAVIASGKPFQYEARVRRADGEYRWMLHHKVPLRDEEGDIVKWYGSSIDIEDRKRAEMQWRLLIDAIPQQIWSGPPDGSLDYCNERWRSYMGLGLQELRGDGWQAMLHPDDRDRVLKAWCESVATGTPYEQEERHRGADGGYRWFLSRGLPLRDAEGRIVRWYGTNTDIEHRKRADKEVEAANHQLRSLSGRLLHVQEEERRHLARELHDEIGQALTAAKINTDMLRSAAPSDLCERLNENATILDRVLQQTRQISLDLRPPVLDDLGLVAALRWYVDQQAKRAGLRARFSADSRADEASAPIQTACFRLAQEAITNAIRHAGATTLTVEVRQSDSSLSLVVQDDGVGFDVAKAEARAAQGASLGLIGIKERAALAGGRTRIVSSPGKGTTVEIHLPLHGVEPVAPVSGISQAAFPK
ncbi:MAG: hypothetical protein V7609_2157 [Verrucomicrobiota bacterium]